MSTEELCFCMLQHPFNFHEQRGRECVCVWGGVIRCHMLHTHSDVQNLELFLLSCILWTNWAIVGVFIY